MKTAVPNVSGTLLILGLSLVAACAPVAGNFPQQTKKQSTWVRDDSAAEYIDENFSIKIGDRMQLENMVARRQEQLARMAAGAGKASRTALEAKGRQDFPYLYRLLDDSQDYSFYKGEVRVLGKIGTAVERGDFLITFLVGGDSIQVPDDGVVFINHNDSNQSLYTQDGAVHLVPGFNGQGLDRPNRVLVRSRTRGTVLDVAFAKGAREDR